MDRNTLITYSLYFNGDYNKITKAIDADFLLPLKTVDNAITIFDSEYPLKLLDLKYPPYVLYYKGDLNLLKDSSIAIVGSRKPSEYAVKATKGLVEAKNDKVIISGLAKGIDAVAHLYACKTIGILGCGIDYIYPKENYDLIKKVEKHGLILSEYPGFTKPLGYHFPFRNRLIVALSELVYVMQSTIRSGTMTTVNEALEMGKEVRVLPYDIFDENGINNNNLIFEGATPIERKEIAI